MYLLHSYDLLACYFSVSSFAEVLDIKLYLLRRHISCSVHPTPRRCTVNSHAVMNQKQQLLALKIVEQLHFRLRSQYSPVYE